MRKIISLIVVSIFSVQAYAIETKAKQAYLVDFSTGTVLFEKNADQKMAPSSMSKLMTCYVVFEALKNGDLKKDDSMTISQNAWQMQGSKTFVPVGEQVKVEDLLRGVIVQSGNDATVALAEGISGTEQEFANRLNNKATALGMHNSQFKNSTGWPHPEHLTTAHDLANLAIRLITDFPEYYGYFAETEFTFNNITQGNRNLLLGKDLGVDGLKTGHTDVGGYGIVISAVRDGRRLVLVVNGLANEKERAEEARNLLNYGFMNFSNVTVARANEVVMDVPVWLGTEKVAHLITNSDVIVTVPVDLKKSVNAEVRYRQPLYAPVVSGNELATLILRVGEAERAFPLFSDRMIEQASFMEMLYERARLLFKERALSPLQKEETTQIECK